MRNLSRIIARTLGRLGFRADLPREHTPAWCLLFVRENTISIPKLSVLASRK